jgi:hypothetical protein
VILRDKLIQLYDRFNARDIDAVLAELAPDVTWPNGWEGGFEHGREAVRAYWTRQWAELDPTVTPTAFEDLADGRVRVTVYQVVKNLDGAALGDETVFHMYAFEGEFIARMDISR